MNITETFKTKLTKTLKGENESKQTVQIRKKVRALLRVMYGRTMAFITNVYCFLSDKSGLGLAIIGVLKLMAY